MSLRFNLETYARTSDIEDIFVEHHQSRQQAIFFTLLKVGNFFHAAIGEKSILKILARGRLKPKVKIKPQQTTLRFFTFTAFFCENLKLKKAVGEKNIAGTDTKHSKRHGAIVISFVKSFRLLSKVLTERKKRFAGKSFKNISWSLPETAFQAQCVLHDFTERYASILTIKRNRFTTQLMRVIWI